MSNYWYRSQITDIGVKLPIQGWDFWKNEYNFWKPISQSEHFFRNRKLSLILKKNNFKLTGHFSTILLSQGGLSPGQNWGKKSENFTQRKKCIYARKIRRSNYENLEIWHDKKIKNNRTIGHYTKSWLQEKLGKNR